MMRNNDIKELWDNRACPSYEGDEPYVYLSFAPYALKEGLAALSILNELGCRIRYNEKMLTGRPWTSEISEAIEGCSVFFEINAPGYHFFLTKTLAHEFADLLEKKTVIVRLKNSIPDEPSGYPTLIYTSPDDPSYPDLCRQALEHTGYFSAGPEKSSVGRYDLMLAYYKTSEDWKHAFGGLISQKLNLRTHESYGYLGHYPRSDEDVYTAVRYGKKEYFYLYGRSTAEDYKPDRADKQFSEKVLDPEWKGLKGFDYEPWVPKHGRPFPADYPYKDEFDLLGSDEDED